MKLLPTKLYCDTTSYPYVEKINMLSGGLVGKGLKRDSWASSSKFFWQKGHKIMNKNDRNSNSILNESSMPLLLKLSNLRAPYHLSNYLRDQIFPKISKIVFLAVFFDFVTTFTVFLLRKNIKKQFRFFFAFVFEFCFTLLFLFWHSWNIIREIIMFVSKKENIWQNSIINFWKISTFLKIPTSRLK